MATTSHALSAPDRRQALVAAVLGGGFLVLGVAVAAKPVVVAALVVMALGAVVAIQRPHAVVFAAVILLSVVPVYAAPKLGPLALNPVVLACWLAAGALVLLALLGDGGSRFTAIDGAMALYFGLLLLPVLYGIRPKTDYIALAFTALGPFLAMRLVIPRLPISWLPRAFAISAAVALPFVLYESATGTNPFERFDYNPTVFAAWAESQFRFGVLRAEGAFGQAISLSQFAATVMLLAIGGAVLTARARSRLWWLATIVVAGTLLVLSLSRTGWVVLFLGVVLIGVAVTTGVARSRLAALLVATVAFALGALAVAGLSSVVLRLFDDSQLSGSNDYREVLIHRALRGDGLAWLGYTRSSLGAGIEGTQASIDNAYLAIAAFWGYVGLIGFCGIVAAVALAVWERRGTARALVPAVTLANLIGLFQVGINTQTGFWLWMLVGASAAAMAAPDAPPSLLPKLPALHRSRARPREPASPTSGARGW